MKNLAILLAGILISSAAFSQSDSTAEIPVYRRFPTIPKFTVYKAPDSTAFTKEDLNKKENTVFIIFSPDCEYCQHETSMLTQSMSKFKKTQFVMITYLPYEEMIQFYKNYKIADFPQIVMARDTRFFFPEFFKIRNLPSIFIYDKHGKLKKSFEGDVKPETILAEL